MKLADAKNPFEWLFSGKPAVDAHTSLSRAAICVTCPKNNPGPLSAWFTLPVARAIKGAIAYRTHRKLSTLYDAALGTCDACKCVLVLKCHEPVELVQKQLKPRVKEKLWHKCWILRELQDTDAASES